MVSSSAVMLFWPPTKIFIPINILNTILSRLLSWMPKRRKKKGQREMLCDVCPCLPLQQLLMLEEASVAPSSVVGQAGERAERRAFLEEGRSFLTLVV